MFQFQMLQILYKFQVNQSKMLKNPQEQFHFVFDGKQYDASSYYKKHPGGKEFFDNMKAQRKDITQYFKALHSDNAEKTLKSFPVVGSAKTTPSGTKYLEIEAKLRPYYDPIITYQILIQALFIIPFIVAIYTKYALVSVLGFAFSQILAGWYGHSGAHSRASFYKRGLYPVGVVGGFSMDWWSPKHNMHHVFTNSMRFDDDIKHSYYVFMYPFLYLKWRFDSIISSVANRNYTQIFYIALGYVLIASNPQNIPYFILGQLIGGYFSANLLIGNHQRQKRYVKEIEGDFFDHQLITCRNYDYTNLFWVLLMGGMQFQSEHHLFPQIPFYRIKEALPIIHAELKKMNKTIIYGPVM